MKYVIENKEKNNFWVQKMLLLKALYTRKQ